MIWKIPWAPCGKPPSTLSSQQATLTALMVQLENQQAEIQAYLLETGFCPLCGSPLDLKHFLEGWHG